MSVKLRLLLAAVFSCLLFPEHCGARGMVDSLHLYRDLFYLGNMYYGSSNPVSVSYLTLNKVTDLNIGWMHGKGVLRRIDEPSKEQWWNGSLFGMQKFGKVTFMGDVHYENGKQIDKRWNSTLFIADDNPFIVGDSLSGDYNVEKFKLSGGFSYEINSSLKAGLRADYEVGSSADQTDPRPDIKGMRFLLNPGIDCRLGDFIIGLSGGVRWLSESVDYTAVKTYENYQLFLFKGMGNYEGQQAVGFTRKYTGTAYQSNLQFLWDSQSSLANFLELGIESSVEEAIDGKESNKYKGGKYDNTRYSVSNRFRILKNRAMHNISFEVTHSQTEGTWYIQTQSGDADGNTFWEVRDASVCHKETTTDASLFYRLDLLKYSLLHFTGKMKGGIRWSETLNYPEIYMQKYTSAHVGLDLSKNLSVKKSILSIYLSGLYNYNLSSKSVMDGLKLKDIYTRLSFDALSASYCQGMIGASVTVPFSVSSFHFGLGVYADYSMKYYSGDSQWLNGQELHRINVGMNLRF